jgi:chromosome segregation ATPase
VAAAAEEANMQSAQTSFDYTLATLRRSVDTLTQENRDLPAANDRLRARLASLRGELSTLQRDESRVLEQFSALEIRYQKKMAGARSLEQQIARLREEASALDNKMAELSMEIAARKNSDADLRILTEKMEGDIRSLISGQVTDSDTDAARLTNDRDQLREQVRLSSLSLQSSREEWLDLQGVIQGGPDRVDALKKQRDSLVAAVAAKRASSAQLVEKVALEQQVLAEIPSPQKIGPDGISGLEQEVRSLNEKYRGLSKEFAVLQKGDDKARRGDDPVENERRKREAQLTTMSERNKSLKAELDRLRKQMVDMDKKKVQLEKIVYGGN